MFLGMGIIILIVGALVIVWGFVEDEILPKIVGSAIMIFGLTIGSLHFFTESGQRMVKSIKSDIGGGIERKVEVYDQQGNLIRTYEGAFDVESSEYGNKVLFDLDGKRTIIYNATVIVQEK